MIFNKNNKLLPYGMHSVTKEDIHEVNKVLRGNKLTQGEKINEFEDAIARKVGSSMP